jgi:transposase
MPLISEQVHPLSLDFENQRKVVIRRSHFKEAWSTIAGKVKNLAGDSPSDKLVARVYKTFSKKAGRRRYKYKRCGRRPWKLTKPIQQWLIRTLRNARRSSICTSTTLQQKLAKVKGIQVEASAIRRLLCRKGYHWLPRSGKQRYSKEVKKQRVIFANQVVALSPARLREKLSLAMDGVIVSTPPKTEHERWNHCHVGDTHVYRKKGEISNPDLDGGGKYAGQVPLARAIPLWGGVSEGGFATVVVHKKKKLTKIEWGKVVDAGKLEAAIKRLGPIKPDGPWHVICDNESFIDSDVARAAHRRAKVRLWQIPARSPDLNPVEKFWSWLRRRLRKLDLQDLREAKPVMGRAAYTRRVRQVLKSHAAQKAAASCARGLRKVCLEVIKKKGAASRS